MGHQSRLTSRVTVGPNFTLPLDVRPKRLASFPLPTCDRFQSRLRCAQFTPRMRASPRPAGRRRPAAGSPPAQRACRRPASRRLRGRWATAAAPAPIVLPQQTDKHVSPRVVFADALWKKQHFSTKGYHCNNTPNVQTRYTFGSTLGLVVVWRTRIV